jgi:hypothetical protein
MIDSHVFVLMKRNVRASIAMQKRLRFPRKVESYGK